MAVWAAHNPIPGNIGYMAPRISPKQFGPLFHGTNVPGLDEINQSKGNIRYSAMPRIHGWNFATNTLTTAIDYAREGSARDKTKTGKASPAVVYEVEPQRVSDTWGPDPDSGPGGWNDGPRNKREALDIHEGGGEVSLRFGGPLRAKREVFVEDRARDITPSTARQQDLAYILQPEKHPMFPTRGVSFS